MRDDLLALVEREVLGWPGVGKDTGRPGCTVYRFGRREIGHVHRDGVADLPFPKTVHDELIRAGEAAPHRAGFPGYVSYHVQAPEDVPGAVELFRRNYERARKSAGRRASRSFNDTA